MSSATQRQHQLHLPLPPRRINRMPSVNDLVTTKSLQSPLTQLRVGVESRKDEASQSQIFNRPLPHSRSTPSNAFASSSSGSRAPPLPAIEFNLFRTASVYSVDSVSSMSTVTTDDDGPLSLNNTASAFARPESPTTPKASQFQKDEYFEPPQAQAGPSRPQHTLHENDSRPTLKPKSSFVVRSRKDDTPLSSHAHRGEAGHRQFNRPRAQSRPEPPTQTYQHTRAAPPQEAEIPDHASVHGEQGSDWGDDEQNFEWVDTLNAPEEVNGTGKNGGGLSPSKRLSRLKAAVVPGAGPSGDGRKLRKQLTFARRAPPPPVDKQPAPPLGYVEDGSSTPPATSRTLPPTLQRGLSRSARFHAIPLRPSNAQPTVDTQGRPYPERSLSEPVNQPTTARSMPQARKAPPPPMQLAPTMMPLKGDKTSPIKRGQRTSQMSFQSVAYSLYDLDGDTTTPIQSPGGTELAFPKGRYTKVKASALELDTNSRTRKISEKSTGSGGTVGAGSLKSPEEFVAAGIEARGKGDLAKSAWYFMRATEGGSLTGKMYYGLALRHGWGIAKDEKKAFNLLRQACDDLAISQGQNQFSKMDIQQSKGTVKLSLAQKKEMTRDLSLGLFEIANCFLEGSGTKKSPEVALNYLKLAANMGDLASQERFLLSKGSSGVRKDMKEASRWYRMAISSGSSNTIGLAWVWKEKYMA